VKNLEPEEDEDDEEEETSGIKPLFSEDEEVSHRAENVTGSKATGPPSSAGVKNPEPEEDEEETSDVKPLLSEDEGEVEVSQARASADRGR